MEYCKICGRVLNDCGFCDDPECMFPVKVTRSENTIQQDLRMNDSDYRKLMNQLFDEL